MQCSVTLESDHNSGNVKMKTINNYKNPYKKVGFASIPMLYVIFIGNMILFFGFDIVVTEILFCVFLVGVISFVFCFETCCPSVQEVSSSMIVAYESTAPLNFDVPLGLHTILGASLHSSFVPLLKATCNNYLHYHCVHIFFIYCNIIFLVYAGSIQIKHENTY